jgi:hypothetical protein
MDIILEYPDLVIIFNKNDNNIKNKILKLLHEKPSDCDGCGYIYGFYSPKDRMTQKRNNFWIKLGRTERNPFTRVEDEWGGELIFCLKTSYNHRLERLLHLFFDFARQTRIGICDQKPYEKIEIGHSKKNNVTVYTQTEDITKNKSSFTNFLSLFSCLCCSENNIKIKNDDISHYEPISEIYKKVETEIHREVEWFHFNEITNVISLSSQIWQLVEFIYNGSFLKDEKNDLIQHEEIHKININTASLEQLMTIPNVGKIIATKIIEYRQTNKFASIEDIKHVHNSLSFKFDKIKNRICI